MSLAIGISILALAVLLGGFAALWREHGRHVMPGIRMFAVVAAVSIALVHLLPDAIAAAGWWTVFAAFGGFLAPALLESIPFGRGHSSHRSHSQQAPSIALAIGYAAVLAHQLGEGAAVAALARTGELSLGVVLAIAAHTTPLAMVIAIRVLEVKRGQDSGSRAMALALAGLGLATGTGALIGTLITTPQLDAAKPWILAGISGILLHALAHDSSAPPAPSLHGRAGEALAGLAGLGTALTGLDDDNLVTHLGSRVRWLVTLGIAATVVTWSLLRRGTGSAHSGSVPHIAIKPAAETPPGSAPPDLRN